MLVSYELSEEHETWHFNLKKAGLTDTLTHTHTHWISPHWMVLGWHFLSGELAQDWLISRSKRAPLWSGRFPQLPPCRWEQKGKESYWRSGLHWSLWISGGRQKRKAGCALNEPQSDAGDRLCILSDFIRNTPHSKECPVTRPIRL